MASVKAKPKIAYPNKAFVMDGLREIAVIKLPNTIPIPAPITSARDQAAVA